MNDILIPDVKDLSAFEIQEALRIGLHISNLVKDMPPKIALVALNHVTRICLESSKTEINKNE